MEALQCPVCGGIKLALAILETEGDEVKTGAILCESCHRWYPIINSIPHMLTDELRGSEDALFIRENQSKFDKMSLQERPPIFQRM